jgi:hypothetical protein
MQKLDSRFSALETSVRDQAAMAKSHEKETAAIRDQMKQDRAIADENRKKDREENKEMIRELTMSLGTMLKQQLGDLATAPSTVPKDTSEAQTGAFPARYSAPRSLSRQGATTPTKEAMTDSPSQGESAVPTDTHTPGPSQ